ncbi:MAG: SCO family protein [Alphaproteobacteria bacterium]|nr:SCO family protein [Alphaproteobacteria bacterium]
MIGLDPRTSLGTIVAAVVLACSTVGVASHEGVVHKSDEEAARHIREQENTPGFPSIKGGDFKLVDQFGAERTSKDPDNRYQLVFFGYANCKAICSVALPRMAEVADRLEAEGLLVTPLLITVDPERDTVAALAEAAPKYHSRLVGLTGSQQALDEAYRAFQIERSIVFVDPQQGAVYAHGSYIYLIGPDGTFKTLFPPILSPERIAELVREYVNGKS